MSLPLDGFRQSPLYEVLLNGLDDNPGPLFTDEASAEVYAERMRHLGRDPLVMKVPVWTNQEVPA